MQSLWILLLLLINSHLIKLNWFLITRHRFYVTSAVVLGPATLRQEFGTPILSFSDWTIKFNQRVA